MCLVLQPASPPPTVFLPAVGEPAGGQHQVELQMVDDVLVVVAYSSLTALVGACGPEQRWVAMRAEDVEELREQWAAAAVLLDPVHEQPGPAVQEPEALS